MSDDRRDLVATDAVGALSPAESAALAAELERDPALALELEGYRSAVSMLETHVARETPTHDLFAGILAEIQPDSTPAPMPAPRTAWSWRRVVPAFAAGALATAAVFVVALALGSSSGLGTPDAVAAVNGTENFAGVHGEARIYETGTRDGILRLDLADVPAPAEGEHYEVWVLRPASGDLMEAVGVFNPTSPNVSLELSLPGAGDYVAVDISVEPDAGAPEHSGTSLAGGRFEPGTT